MCLNSIFDILDEEYSDSFIYPVDDKKYWIDKYSSLNQLNVDNRIKKYCIFYDYFYNCYSEYVKIYISDEHYTPNIDIFSTDVIWATNYLEENIDKLNNQLIDRVNSVMGKKANRDTVKELINRQCSKYGLKSSDEISEELKEKMYIDFNNNFTATFIQKYEEQSEMNRELINKLRKINLYSVEDYYKITRNLSISQKKETGKFATIVIENNLEIINLMRIITNELSKDNKDYVIIYNQLTTLLEDSSRLIYGSFSKYILDSKVENLEKDTQHYVNERINIMYILLLTYIVNGSIDNILQCKSMLLPYVHSDNIIVQQNFEKSIQTILDSIKNKLKSNENISKISDYIVGLVNEYNNDKALTSDMISTLSTAEYLYQIYVLNKQSNKVFDYSFISIMYYQAIENILNNLIFIPYKRFCEFSHINRNNAENYFKSPKKYGYYKSNSFILKSSIELGPLGYLLQDIDECDTFKNFILNKYDVKSLEIVQQLGNQIKLISKRRNTAAHATKVDLNTTIQDKTVVFDDTIQNDDIQNMRNLLMNTLKLFVSK